MSSCWRISLALVLSLVLLAPPCDAKVAKLDANSFAMAVNHPSANSIVMFHAPWCGHCKELKPNFQELAQDYLKHEKVLVGTVDCSEYREFCRSKEVTAYPTLKFWVNGVVPKEVPEKYKKSTEKGVYLEWHDAIQPAGFKRLREFVADVLAEGIAPDPRPPTIPPPPPSPPKQGARPKGWWKTPEKYKTPEDQLPEPQMKRKGVSGLDLGPEARKITGQNAGREAATQRNADKDEL